MKRSLRADSRAERERSSRPSPGRRITAAGARRAIDVALRSRPDLVDDPRITVALSGRGFWREFAAAVAVLRGAAPGKWDLQEIEGDGLKGLCELAAGRYAEEAAAVLAAIHVGLTVIREDDDRGKPRFWVVTISRRWWREQVRASMQQHKEQRT